MPRLNNPRQEAVAQMKAEAYLNPAQAPSDVQIVRKAYGYSQDSAESNAVTIMESKGVQSRLIEILNERVPDDKAALKTKQLLDCKKIIRDKSGNIIGKDPDNASQIAVLNLIYRAKGAMGNSVGDTFIDARSVRYDLANSQSQILDRVLGCLDQMSTKLDQYPVEIPS